MDPVTLSALASAIPSIFQLISGAGERSTAADLSKTPRPLSTTPPEITEMLNNARRNAGMSNAPGVQAGINEGVASSAQRLQNVSPSSASLLSSTADLAGKGIVAGAQSGTEYQKTAQNALSDALGVGGAYTQKNWQWNEADPYLLSIGTAGRLNEAGRQDEFGAANNLTGAAQNYGKLSAIMKLLNGGKNKTTAPGTDWSTLANSTSGTGDFNTSDAIAALS